jgi:hypothetical protein
MARLWKRPVELRILWACLISDDLMSSTKFGKLEPKVEKHRGVEVPGVIPVLHFLCCAILLTNVVSSVSVRGVTLR